MSTTPDQPDLAPQRELVIGPAPAMLLGIRRSALLELVLFLAVALLLDATLFAGQRFRDVSPHPFWIIVLLLSVEYGATAGLVAALAAAAALLIGHLPPQSPAQDLHAWLLRIEWLPVLWIATALVLGGLRDRHRGITARLRAQLAAAHAREHLLVESLEQTVRLKDGLEEAAAGQLHTASSFISSMRAIERLDTSEVILGVRALVRAVLNPEKFSVFLLRGTTLEAVLEVGWSRTDTHARAFGSDTELFQAIVAGRQTLAVFREADQRVLGIEGALATPLLAVETGNVLGMLKIERLDLAELTPATIHTCTALGEWIGHAYETASRYEHSVEAPARPFESAVPAWATETTRLHIRR